MPDNKCDTSMLSMLIFLYSFLNSFTLTFIASTCNHMPQAMHHAFLTSTTNVTRLVTLCVVLCCLCMPSQLADFVQFIYSLLQYMVYSQPQISATAELWSSLWCTLILFQTLALYKSFTYLLTYLFFNRLSD